MSCTSNTECQNAGTCVNGECKCDVGWFDDYCTDNLKLKWPAAFYSYRVTFILLYAILAFYVLVRLHQKTRQESKMLDMKKRKVILVGLKSPLNMVYRLVILLCITQIIWLAVDPFDYNHVFSRPVERLFAEAALSLMFIIYAIVLWVWYSIYQELSSFGSKKKKHIKWARTIIIVFVVLFVGAQIVVSVLEGLRGTTNRRFALALYIVIFVFEVFCIGGLSINAVLLYKRIQAQERAFDEKTPKSLGLSSTAVEQPHYHYMRLSKRNLKSSSKLPSNSQNLKKSQKQGSIMDEDLNQIDTIPRTSSFEVIKLPSIKKTQSMELKNKSEPDELKDRLDHKIQELQGKNKYDVILEDEVENVEDELDKEIPKLKEPRLFRAVTTTVEMNTLNERRIRDILKRDEEYFKPVRKHRICYNIDSDIPVIISNTKDFVWEVPEEEKPLRNPGSIVLEEKKKEELEMSVERIRRKLLPSLNIPPLTTTVSLEAYEKKLLEDPEYVMHQKQVIKSDEAIIKKIVGLTSAAIIFGVISALINLLLYLEKTFQTPAGVFVFLWLYGLLTIASAISILLLFSLVRNQEKENLRLISRMGQTKSRINKIHAFVLPDYLRKEESKVRFVEQINYVTTGNSNFLPPSALRA